MRRLSILAAVVGGLLVAAPHAASAAAPRGAVLRLKTGTLGLTSSGAGRAPAVLAWAQGSSPARGVRCCTSRVYEGDSTYLGQTSAASWPLTLRDGSGYSFRIDAYDSRGTFVGTALSDPPSYADGYGIIDSTAFSYAGAWHSQDLVGAWHGSVESSTAAGATATIQLGCRAFGLVMTKGPAYGSARVMIDGASTTINLHATRLKRRQIILVRNYAEDPAEAGPTVTITNLGTRGHSRVDVNAVEAIEID